METQLINQKDLAESGSGIVMIQAQGRRTRVLLRMESQLNPGTTYYRGNSRTRKPRFECRYDFIYASTHFEPTACHYSYEEAANGPTPLSDHALVVADLRLTTRSADRATHTKASATMVREIAHTTSRPANIPADIASIPDVAAYEEAFREMLPRLAHGYRQMLLANLNAPAQAATPHYLAEAAGYSNYATVNLHYGKLGGMIGNRLRYRPTKLSLQGKECKTFAFADWQGGKWELLDNAAAALTNMGLRSTRPGKV